jgi:hypothetical protein
MSIKDNSQKTLKQAALEGIASITPEVAASEITRLSREVGRDNARQQATLNEIDRRLLSVLDGKVELEMVEMEDGSIEEIEVTKLSDVEVELAEISVLLSVLLREAWTYS